MASLPFQLHHAAMLLKYSGISFISGAVNHGFFSGERSLWTAATGVLLFVLGVWMEHRMANGPRKESSEFMRALVWGSLLSIGLGFFTGGLQHFPDSPARSAWVVPLGFVISVPALLLHESVRTTRSITVYALALGIAISALSWGTYQWLLQNPQWAGQGHSHGDEGHSSTSPVSGAVVNRVLEIRMGDNMRFTPSSFEAVAGETVRLVVYNDGKAEHELVLGTTESIKEHAESMKNSGGHTDGHSHGGGAAISVTPGKSGELVVTFAQPGELQIACLLPGHFEAGMHGSVQVLPAGSTLAGASAATQTKAKAAGSPAGKGAHDHSTHKH